MSLFTEGRWGMRAALVVLLVASSGCQPAHSPPHKSPTQVVYITTPQQCLSCNHAWQLFECLRSRCDSSNVQLVALLRCERAVEASGWTYSNSVDSVIVSTTHHPSPLYMQLSELGDFQLFVVSDEKVVGRWSSSALTGRICDSVMRVIEHD